MVIGLGLVVTKPFTAERIETKHRPPIYKRKPLRASQDSFLEEVINKLQYIRSFQKDKIVLTGPGVNAKEIISKIEAALKKARSNQDDTNKSEPWVG